MCALKLWNYQAKCRRCGKLFVVPNKGAMINKLCDKCKKELEKLKRGNDNGE